jgi:hypothetical protein
MDCRIATIPYVDAFSGGWPIQWYSEVDSLLIAFREIISLSPEHFMVVLV